MEYQEFINLNRKYSGSMSKECFVKKNFPDFYEDLEKYKKLHKLINRGFKEIIYSYFKNDTDEKKCKCGNSVRFYSIEKGYATYCSMKCSNKGNVEIIKKIKMDKHGDPNYNNPAKFKETIRVKIEESGKSILEKRRKTKLEKYGDPNFTNVNKIMESKRKTTLNLINKKLKEFEVCALEVSDNSYLIQCQKCGKQSKVLNSRLNSRLRKNIDPCIVCYDYNTGVSSSENEIYDYIKSLGLDPIKNDRKILDGMEIDVFLPHANLGFEYNGLYWHSELNKDKNYHINKQDLAKSKGIKLINIWEDDWENKKDIVKSKINYLLNIKNRVVFARKCRIEEISHKSAKEFLISNHLQGFCPAKTSIGLFFKDELISVCTFGKRKISGTSANEILRFANRINHHIPGGFSKILNYYIKKYNPSELITFADRSWSPDPNNIYMSSGFQFLHTTKPNYWYIVDGERTHRFNYRKDILVKNGYDKNLTEREIMMDLGINRIYDCGQYKYSLCLD